MEDRNFGYLGRRKFSCYLKEEGIIIGPENEKILQELESEGHIRIRGNEIEMRHSGVKLARTLIRMKRL